MYYDLDESESIDVIKICHTEYKVGDIPLFIKDKLENIKSGILRSKEKQALSIIKELLELWNEDVVLKKWNSRNIKTMMVFIQKKLDDDKKYS